MVNNLLFIMKIRNCNKYYCNNPEGKKYIAQVIFKVHFFYYNYLFSRSTQKFYLGIRLHYFLNFKNIQDNKNKLLDFNDLKIQMAGLSYFTQGSSSMNLDKALFVLKASVGGERAHKESQVTYTGKKKMTDRQAF